MHLQMRHEWFFEDPCDENILWHRNAFVPHEVLCYKASKWRSWVVTSVLELLLIWMPSQDVCEILHIVNYQQVRSFVFSISLAGLSGCSLRDFPMSIARILWIYSFWDAVMLKSGSCSNCIRVKISFLYFKLPKANVFQAPSAVMEVWVATPDSIIHVGAQNTVREVCVSHQHRIPE